MNRGEYVEIDFPGHFGHGQRGRVAAFAPGSGFVAVDIFGPLPFRAVLRSCLVRSIVRRVETESSTEKRRTFKARVACAERRPNEKKQGETWAEAFDRLEVRDLERARDPFWPPRRKRP